MRSACAVLLLTGCSLTGLPDVSSGNDAAVPLLFEADFEQPGALPDAGGWSRLQTFSAGNFLQVGPEAAHRGSGGLIITDNAGGTGNSSGAVVLYELDAGYPDIYLRYWLRVRQNNYQGYVITTFFATPNNTRPTSTGFTGDVYVLIGEHEDGGMQFRNKDTRFDAGQWELLESSVRACDGGTCRVQLWAGGRDAGELIVNRPSRVDTFGLGSPAHGLEFVGIADIDDFRVSTVPHASALVVTGEGGTSDCAGLRVELLDAWGNRAFAPHDFEAVVFVDGGEAFGDDGCKTEPKVRFRRGGQAVNAWWRPRGDGPFEASASNIDFRSVPRPVSR